MDINDPIEEQEGYNPEEIENEPFEEEPIENVEEVLTEDTEDIDIPEEDEDELLLEEGTSYEHDKESSPTPQEEIKRLRIGITHGDFNGIGYEVIIKTLADAQILELFIPIIYGSAKVASYYRKALNIMDFSFFPIRRAEHADPKRINLLNIFDREVRIEFGKSSEVAGQLSLLALEQAVNDLKNGHIDALVTAPVNKKNIQSPGFHFPGHTEYLASKLNSEDFMMMMVYENIRVGFITGHIPLKDISGYLSRELVLKKLRVFHQSLIKDFGIRKPRIALLGMNPHAGDNNLLGNEEEDIFMPAIHDALEENILVVGPYPADGFFGTSTYTHFDGIMAVYHDQGLIPFKILAFEKGVNYTAGLAFIRTSPAHGTAYEIAGKNEASPDSFRQAIYLAIDLFKKRKEYEELTANPLQKADTVEEGADLE
jgi:4-hydroxythreonine-4-phosphate dehydrogenase